MKILLVHAFYQQAGGEDRMFEADRDLLQAAGHEVLEMTFDNREMDTWSTLRTARNVIWNPEAVARARETVRDTRPDIVHVHNFFPSLSPGILRAFSEAGVPVVLNLPNYRLMCVNGTLYREGAVCQSCVGKAVAWAGIRHGCYRSSRLASAGVAGMNAVHRLLGTWSGDVSAFLALDPDGRDRFIAGGLAPDKVYVRPNYLTRMPTPGQGSGGHAIYAGRLTAEKGVRTLLRAWADMDAPARLIVAGDGPLAEEVRTAAATDDRIEFVGWKTAEELGRLVGEAALSIVPSEWAEPFGLVALEALARGTPVVATRLGGLQHLVSDGKTGRLVDPGDGAQLAHAVSMLMTDPEALRAMRVRARESVEVQYSAETAIENTERIYRRLLRNDSPSPSGGSPESHLNRGAQGPIPPTDRPPLAAPGYSTQDRSVRRGS